MDPALRELMEGGGEDEVEAVVRLEPGEEPPPHVRIVARFGDVATCRLPRERIAETWADESVVSLKAPRPFGVDPDPLPAEGPGEGVAESGEAVAGSTDERRPAGLDATGRGVVVAVVDWGFDFAHPNFRNADGSTRALAFWDQSAPGPGPEPYGYGRVYGRAEIDRALRTDDPYRALGYHPASGDPTGRGAHGTHVLDIAAGNGRAEGAPEGMAPAADILFVHLATRGTEGRANLGDSVTLLEALDWIARTAGERPWVINMSVGRHGGPHTGRTLVERGIDALLGAAPGRAIVQSTGNYYQAAVHAAGVLRPGQERTLSWWTDQADVTPNELEVWYPGADTFGVEVLPPSEERAVRVPLGGQAAIEVGGREVGRAYHRAKDPSDGDNHVDVFLYADAPPGRWRVTLSGEDVVDGRWHAWVERDAGCPRCQSRLDPEDADSATTTGTIANGYRSIAVGAYDAHSPGREVAPFSSCGPTRDGRVKPDLAAPGVRILAARSAALELGSDTPLLTRNSGTSMAAPHVTGTVALMFETAARPLAIRETRKLLISTAREAEPGSPDEERVGSGYLDVERAVAAARSLATPRARDRAAEAAAREGFREALEQAAREPEPLIGPEAGAEVEAGAALASGDHHDEHETDGTEDAMRGDEAMDGATVGEPEELEDGVGLHEAPAHECACGRGGRTKQMAESAESDESLGTWSGEVVGTWPWPGSAGESGGGWREHEEADEPAGTWSGPAESPGTSWTDPGAELLALAEDAVMAGPWGPSLLDRVVAHVAESAGTSFGISSESAGESVGAWIGGGPASPAALFDAVVAGGVFRRTVESAFEVVALPGEALAASARAGDLLLRRGLGEGGLGHVAMVAGGEALAAGGLAGEGFRPGSYLPVVEAGPRPHALAEGFARLAVNAAGRLPMDQLLLRPRLGGGAAEWDEATPAGKGTTYVRWIQESLNRVMGAGLKVDGDPGPKTRAAIKAFQARQGLKDDGVVGPKTEAALVAAGAAPPPGAAASPATGAPPAPGPVPAGAACAGPSVVLDRFELDKSTLTADHRAAIAKVADDVIVSRGTATPVEAVCLVGHTDTSGDDPHNLKLGEDRARAVEAELRRQLDAKSPGLSSRLGFAVSSAGESSPLAGDGTAAGRARNRRVELTLARRPAPPPVCPRPQTSKEDPTALDLFPVSSFTYDGGDVPLPGFTGTFRLRGTVFYPADAAGKKPFSTKLAGRAPVVFIAHGNHGVFHDPKNRLDERCSNPGGFRTIPNHEGYDYLQRLLARMGMVAVSIDCNRTNCTGFEAKNIHLRSALIVETMRLFQRFDGSDPIFKGRLDFSRVALLGHSRGGEAVLAAARVVATGGAPGVTVKGVVSLAPTDAKATNGIPQGFAFMTVLPAADGDVTDNDGAKFYDQAVPDPFKCQVYVDGASHNLFNRQWVVDEGLGPGRPSRATHEQILSAYGCAFFRTVLLGHATRKFLEGREVPPGVPVDKAHLSFELPGATTVDDHENRNIALNRLGQPTNQASGFTAAEFDFEQNGAATFNGTFFGKTVGMVAQTSSAAGRFRSQLTTPTDLTGKEVWIRAAEVYDGTSVPAGATGCKLGLEDAAGKVAFVDSDAVGGLPRPYDRRAEDIAAGNSDLTKTMLTTLRFNADCFPSTGLDVTKVAAVQLRLDRNDGRALAFDQLQIV